MCKALQSSNYFHKKKILILCLPILYSEEDFLKFIKNTIKLLLLLFFKALDVIRRELKGSLGSDSAAPVEVILSAVLSYNLYLINVFDFPF